MFLRLRHNVAGFSLIELMITVAIIGIIAAVAYPSYSAYVTKTRRTAAMACLSEYAQYMEQYRATNMRYDQDSGGTAHSLPDLGCKFESGLDRYYSFAFSGTLESRRYILAATPIGVQLEADTECGVLSINQLGQELPADCW